MGEPVVLAALISSGLLLLERIVGWIRNWRKEDAEAGLTVDERWERLTNKYEQRIRSLEERVTGLETERNQLRERIKGLTAEVDKYRSMARQMARHVLKLRDALSAAHVDVPLLPPDIEDALTVIDLP